MNAAIRDDEDSQNEKHESEMSILREDSKSWNPVQWEEYLLKLEAPLLEAQLSPRKFDRLAITDSAPLSDFAQLSASEPLKQAIRDSLEHLTKRQREVVELIYFQARSSREAALALGISQSMVQKLIRKALKNLRHHLWWGYSLSL